MSTRVAGFWRSLAIFLIGGILGTVFGAAAGLFAFPYIFPPPPASDTITAEEAGRVIATGTFIQANPFDPVHYGRGKVTVHEKLVFLGADFEVGPGPKFHVFLVPKVPVRQSAHVEGNLYIDLGHLRAFKGSQKYRIPAGVNVLEYPSVVIWCEKFNVLISPADLNFVTSSTSG